ncbi:39S ribosomal protein L16, mitochondrial [Anthophora plagiata]
MQAYRSIAKLFSTPQCTLKSVPVAGLKSFEPPKNFDDVEFPERNKLRVVSRAPQYPVHIRPYKMQKRLRYLRGPEPFHNTLLHKQYGIIATSGGRMKFKNFETIRLMILRHVDYERVFAIWRVSDPWQPITKKGTGSRMGRGKGSIDHYVTPVKAGQVIIEVGGKIEYYEVKKVLENLAKRLPFDAMAVNQVKLDQMAEEKRKLQEENLNPWTWKYIIQNNMLGCHKWISKYDRRWYNEYL